MAQDQRVTRQLNRLGGIYRDPARVNRDASTLLKSSVGQNLTPISAIHVDDSGTRHTVLVLQGTIAIHFRGNSYQILMDMYLIPGYPARPPLCYVRLVPNMYIKDNHKHVGKDGKVYLPYLSEWKPHSHNLVELTVAMSSVFSADPPVFSRAPQAAAPAPVPPPTAAVDPPPFSQALKNPMSVFTNGWGSSSTTTTTTTNNNTSTSNGTTTPNSWRDQQMQLEQMMAQEAAEANAAAEAARLADKREREELEQKTREMERVKVECTNKIRHYLHQQGQNTQKFVYGDALDKQELEQYSVSKLQQDIRQLEDKKSALQKAVSIVDEKTTEINAWLETAKAAPKAKKELSIDELVVPVSSLHEQMLELAAETESLSDALYFADRALQQHQIDVTQHLKLVRQIAKKQFFAKALLLKIERMSMHRTAL